MKRSLQKSVVMSGVAVLSTLLLASVAFSQQPTDVKRMKEAPGKGISVTLAVFSGRTNPNWWVREGDELKRLLNQIKSIRTSKQALFDYSKWNRLGFASFYLRPVEIEKMPYLIHIWRDEAYVFKDKKGPGLYAKGVSGIYDILVSQAEKKGHKQFFVKYHESKLVE